MRKLLGLLCLLPSMWVNGLGQNCFSDAWRAQSLQRHPGLYKQVESIRRFSEQWMTKQASGREKTANTYTIPVVVHVLWKESEENISDEQILSQLDVLNRDFQAENPDKDLVPPAFRSLIADIGITFCLAKRDPEGQVSTGITRTATSFSNIGTAQDELGRFRVYYAESGGADAWDTQQYLNIWIAKRGYGSGQASFPGAALPEEDGIVMDYRYFGTTGPAADNQPYHLGRTLTHEVGHYLDLLHPWGSGSQPNCESDDQVDDTPRQADTYLGDCPQNTMQTCNSPDFYFNFMNFTDDACMAMFTPGQRLRMLAALEGPRIGLLESLGCEPENTGVDPVAVSPFRLGYDAQSARVFLVSPETHFASLSLRLFNLGGQAVWSDRIVAGSFQWLNAPPLPAGLYLLQIHLHNQSFAHKIIVY